VRGGNHRLRQSYKLSTKTEILMIFNLKAINTCIWDIILMKQIPLIGNSISKQKFTIIPTKPLLESLRLCPFKLLFTFTNYLDESTSIIPFSNLSTCTCPCTWVMWLMSPRKRVVRFRWDSVCSYKRWRNEYIFLWTSLNILSEINVLPMMWCPCLDTGIALISGILHW